MSIGSEARLNVILASAKRKLRDIILKASLDEKGYIETTDLQCQPERILTMIEWLKSEGLRVTSEIREEKLMGFGSCDEDDNTTKKVTYYTISW